MKKSADNRLFLTILLLSLALTSCGDTVNNTYTTSDTGASNADLRHLALSNGTLTPAFSAGVTTYTALFIGDLNITITPYPRENDSSVTVNGAVLPHSIPTPPISLAPGQNTITVSVTAPNGTTARTYTITAVRISQESYLKSSNTGTTDLFGISIALSGDTLAVGARDESSNATGVNGNQADNSAPSSGAVYVFTRTGATWSQQAYIKASNTDANDQFGASISLSGDTLAVGSAWEDSNATGVNGNQANNAAIQSGAVYVFTRTSGTWSQQAYLKASNAEAGDFFGQSVSLSGDTLAVGANQEDSNAMGVNGNQTDNSVFVSGAVYVFTRTSGTWSQQAYIKASNTDFGDQFGSSISLSGDTLAVSAGGEDSSATGVNGNQADNSALDSGAVYVFTRTGGTWSQQAYIKSSNTGTADSFGYSISLSGDTLAIGAIGEDSIATGVSGNQTDNSVTESGAVYVFSRAGTTWSQQAYLKASNTGFNDSFGYSVSLSGDTLAIGAGGEDSNATGINGRQADNSEDQSGAVYVFTRTGTAWTQQDYIKASNAGYGDVFGYSVSLSGDTLAVGALNESSNATGINGNQADNSASGSGAVYVFR